MNLFAFPILLNRNIKRALELVLQQWQLKEFLKKKLSKYFCEGYNHVYISSRDYSVRNSITFLNYFIFFFRLTIKNSIIVNYRLRYWKPCNLWIIDFARATHNFSISPNMLIYQIFSIMLAKKKFKSNKRV